MGDMGSGRHWQWGAKDATDVYRRRKRDGLFQPYQSFGWQWSRPGKVVARR